MCHQSVAAEFSSSKCYEPICVLLSVERLEPLTFYEPTRCFPTQLLNFCTDESAGRVIMPISVAAGVHKHVGECAIETKQSVWCG